MNLYEPFVTIRDLSEPTKTFKFCQNNSKDSFVVITMPGADGLVGCVFQGGPGIRPALENVDPYSLLKQKE